MAQENPSRERLRLSELYAGMSDGELRQMAADADSLTDEALEVLEDELEKRGLDVEAEGSVPQEGVEQRQLVTVRQFRDLPEALLAKGMLDSAGIECYLGDDNMVRMDWFISNLLGGVKLKVRAKDFGAALSVLNEPAPAEFEIDGVGKYEQPRCPRCGSLQIRNVGGLDKRFALPALALAAIPLPVTRNGWRCQSCGQEWSDNGPPEPRS